MNFNFRFNGEYYIDRRMKNTPTHCYSTRANNVRLIEDARFRTFPVHAFFLSNIPRINHPLEINSKFVDQRET